MASFLIHHIIGEQFLSKLEQEYNLNISEEKKNSFLIGNLIVDSSNLINGSSNEYQDEKEITHFRNKQDYNLIIKIPNIERFLEKYGKYIIKDISVFGYFFHLYTDKLFFKDLYNMTFSSLDENMQPTIYRNKSKYILIKKSNKIIPFDKFWSNDVNNKYSIYNDYTLMNKILIQNYGLLTNLDKLLSFGLNLCNNYIEEVNYKNIKNTLIDMKQYIEESIKAKNSILNVFRYEDINNFIDYVCSNAINYIKTDKENFENLRQKLLSK